MHRHVVLIGLNYQPKKSTGDKNFWVELITMLSITLKYITIISIRKHPVNNEIMDINGCKVDIRYFSPKLLETPDAEYNRPMIFWKNGKYPYFFGIIEKSLNIKSIIKELKSINKRKPITHIHLMDNFGAVNRIISGKAKKIGATISVSAMAYQGKNPFLYHVYLRLSYKYPDLFVIPYSLSFKRKLLQLGLRNTQVKHIPWGIIMENNNSYKSYIRTTYKKKLGLPENKILFLWAGYLQQIQKTDFLFALKGAKSAIKKGLNAIFFFAFKPESFKKDIQEYNQPDAGIYVQPTSVEQFCLLKTASDIFYSPILNKKCILAPPLTWIEVMSSGIPILTTDVPGAKEIIVDGHTGFIAKNENDLILKMFEIKENFLTMSKYCKQKIINDYNIYDISKKYLELWFSKGKAE